MASFVKQNNTSAIVESGSNANGYYIKFSDGIMRCWGSQEVVMSNTNAKSFTVIFPVTFFDIPKVLISANDHFPNVTFAIVEATSEPSTTQVGCVLLTWVNTIASGTVTAAWEAIGRWK